MQAVEETLEGVDNDSPVDVARGFVEFEIVGAGRDLEKQLPCQNVGGCVSGKDVDGPVHGVRHEELRKIAVVCDAIRHDKTVGGLGAEEVLGILRIPSNDRPRLCRRTRRTRTQVFFVWKTMV